MDMDSSTGANRLGQTIEKRIVKHMEGESSLVLDFGEIKDDESLVTNTFPIPIPKGDYHVLRRHPRQNAEYWKSRQRRTRPQNLCAEQRSRPCEGNYRHSCFRPT